VAARRARVARGGGLGRETNCLTQELDRLREIGASVTERPRRVGQVAPGDLPLGNFALVVRPEHGDGRVSDRRHRWGSAFASRVHGNSPGREHKA